MSVAGPVFEAVKRLSRRLRFPLLQPYLRALALFARERRGKDVTKRLNAVYEESSSGLEPAWEGASLEVLRREKW